MFDRGAMKQIVMQVSFVSVLFVVFAMHGMDFQEFDADFNSRVLATACTAQSMVQVDSGMLSSSLLNFDHVQGGEDVSCGIASHISSRAAAPADECSAEAELAAIALRHDRQPLQDKSVVIKQAKKRKAAVPLTHTPAKRQHVVELAAIKEHVCQYCGKICDRPSHLQRHVRMHTGEKPFACTYDGCDKSFAHNSHLTRHERTHTGKKPFACGDCSKGFTQKGDLTRHMCLHTGEKPYSCGDCDKRFARKSNLTEHMRMHTGEKPFACDACDKRFAQKGNLTQHMRMHTGEKPFACGDCDKRFAQKSNLTKHIYTHTG